MAKKETKKKTTTAVTKRKTTAVSTNIIKPGRGFENMEAEDLIVPYLKIMQPGSPEVQDDDLDIKQGELINSLSQFNYGSSVRFIPLMFRKRRIKWISRDDGGGMACASLDSRVPDTGEMYHKECKFCPHRNWLNNEPPACTLIYGFPAIVLGVENEHKLIIVSFAVTSFKAGKDLVNKLRFLGGDMFGRPFEVSTKKEVKTDGKAKYTYFVLTTAPAGKLKGTELEEAEGWYEFIQTSKTISYHEEAPETDDSDSPPF